MRTSEQGILAGVNLLGRINKFDSVFTPKETFKICEAKVDRTEKYIQSKVVIEF